MSNVNRSHSLRKLPLVNYKLLHETGEKQFTHIDHIEQLLEGSDYLENNAILTIPATSSNMDQSKKLDASQESMRDEIMDFIDENFIDNLIITEDIDAAVNRIEDLRTQYRSIHKNMKQLDADNYDTTHKVTFDETMSEAKHYIIPPTISLFFLINKNLYTF